MSPSGTGARRRGWRLIQITVGYNCLAKQTEELPSRVSGDYQVEKLVGTITGLP
jgi:hypothetical protein